MKWSRNASQISSTIEDICRRRGIDNYYGRFAYPRISINGQEIQLSVLDTPNPKGLILFLPGTNAYALLYGEYLLALASFGYKVVGCDPRCHGQSSGANGAYTIPELVEDVYALVHYFYRQEKLPLFLSGSSQGGIVSFYCAAKEEKVAREERRPSVIKGLVCHNIADLAAADAVELTRWPKFSTFIKKGVLALARWLPEFPVSMALYLNLKIEPVRHMGNAWSILQRDPLLVDMVRMKTLASLCNTPLALPVEALQTPLFLIQAERDTIFKVAYSKRLFDRLSCPKKMVVYAGLPHYMIVDEVPAFIGDVSAWLALQLNRP
ncbi:MAG: alpha/beta hydrolase [Saprospiraceae bacterium]|nr:alpha/beta hydrolase [Saprospiraceae bacterium]